MTNIEGDLSPPEGRFAIVAARFNSEIVEPLLAGAIETLKQHGVKDDRITLVRVPGSFEAPLAAQKLAGSGKYAAVICLGAVIRGDTDHYEHIATAAARGIARAGLDSGVPVIFGVLTCDTDEQAIDRAGGKEGNKGADAARAAIEMVNLFKRIG
jgi:6,7-dimethyl-8-ribityllumazine synthase